MPAALTDLVTTKTPAQFLQQILAALQGIGHTRRVVGSGLGNIYGSGVSASAQSFQVLISTSGGLGVGAFQLSSDGGLTFGSAVTIPSSGVYAIPGTSGVSLNFDVSNAASVTNPFIAGDIYGITTTITTVPVTAWQPGSLPLTLLETDADVDADLSQLIQAIAKGGYVGTAEADWLDLLALNVYGLTRNLATYTQGLETLTAASGVGPYTITAGQLIFATSAGVQFTNTTGGVLSGAGTLQVTLQAVNAGAAGNVGNGTITQLLTPLAGVTASNPDPGGGTWITAFGSDTEGDDALRQRCRDRWASLGTGGPAAAYDAWARAASTSISRTNVYPDGVVPGQVDVVVAGPAGGVTGGVVAAAQAYINARIPLTTTAVVVSASTVAVAVTATVFVQAAFLPLAQQQCPANIQALIAATPIGGTVYLSEVITALSSPTGVSHVTVAAPVADVALTAAQVATLTGPTLTFTVV